MPDTPTNPAINPIHTPANPSPAVILRVAVATPLRRLFDYLPNSDTDISQLSPGACVSVPFGAQKSIVGILIEIHNEPNNLHSKLRAIHTVLPFSLHTELLTLCQWTANYYHYPLGEVCHLALPTLLRKTQATPFELPVKTITKTYQLTTQGQQHQESDFGRAHKQVGAWQILKQQAYTSATQLKAHKISTATLKSLLEKGLIEIIEQTESDAQQPSLPENVLKEEPLTLNSEQQSAFDKIIGHSSTTGPSGFSCHLLEGVTGSGKTEVYLQSITDIIKQGKQVLILVPEIGLTPQTVQRFERRFNVPVATLHSGMTDKQRYHSWADAAAGLAPIVIGTRSAVFTPLPNIGLIIVDEEHDLSYKQQEGVRYSARDVAIIRAQKAAITIILGSATPSLETLHNALSQRYQHLPLRTRATSAQLPIVECVNSPEAELTNPVIDRITQTLAAQQQVLVFINRRGYAPTLMCQDCHWLSECDNCDSRMTLHKHNTPHGYQKSAQYLHCHQCDTRRAMPEHCPQCHSSRLQPLGQGTQRSEEQLGELFKTVPVLRIDRDSMSKKGEFANTLDIINQNQPCIMVGTQMLAKGHHFAKVSLVVILGLDNSFFSADFRGAERMGQLLTQVSGRAGREAEQGTVMIQTQFAEHPLLRLLIDHGYPAFAQQLLSERQLTAMPPYEYLALVRCHAQSPGLAMSFLQQARKVCQSLSAQVPPSHNKPIQLLGPLPATIEKRNNRYHYQLQIKAASRAALHQLLQPLCQQLEQQRATKGLHWLIDVDPQET